MCQKDSKYFTTELLDTYKLSITDLINCLAGKFDGGMSGEFGESPMMHQTKTIQISAVGLRLSESPLSKTSVIQTLFRILKSQKRQFDFLQNQVINEMPV